MSRQYKPLMLVIALLCCATVSPLFAASTDKQTRASVSAEETQLKKLKWSLDAAQKKQAALQSELNNQQQALEALQQQHAPTQDKYFETKRHLQSLKNRAGSSPTLEQMSQIKNEELRFILIESRYEDSNTEVQTKQEALAQTQQALTDTSNKITRLNRQISQQREIIDKSQMLAFQEKSRALEQKERQLEEQAQQSRLEIARLEQLLAQKEQALLEARAETERARAELAALKQQLSLQHSAPAAAIRSNAIASTASAPAKTIGQSSPTKLTVTDSGSTAKSAVQQAAQPGARLVLIDDKKAATSALEKFSKAVSSASTANKHQSDRLIKIKRSGTSASRTSKILEAKGNFQYRGKLRLKGGKYELKIGKIVQQAEIPASARASTYVVLFDNRPNHTAQISIIDRNLLN